jgi:hypothetical protein
MNPGGEFHRVTDGSRADHGIQLIAASQSLNPAQELSPRLIRNLQALDNTICR